MDEDGSKKIGTKAATGEAHNESGFKEQGQPKKVEPIVKESSIQQVAQWKAHKESVRSVQYIDITDEPIVLTSSSDQKVRIFNLRGEKLGTLKQGYMSKGPDYKWNFPMSNFDKLNTIRQTDTELKLIEMRKEMDAKMSTKRLKQVKKMEDD
jgi:WD40 repeat protein